MTRDGNVREYGGGKVVETNRLGVDVGTGF
jgi:hypothetical protein